MATTRKTVIEGIELDIAPLEVVRLKGLLEGESSETSKLCKAAESPGFFYLDVRDSEQYVAHIQEMYAIAEKYFTQPEAVKMRDFVPDNDFRGYKPGESYEASFEIPQDDFGNNGVPLPKVLQPDATALKYFVSYSNDIAKKLITCLSESLLPNSSTRFEDRHRSTQTSNCSVKFYRSPVLGKLADVAENTHTDGGTFTFFYCDKWGLQIKLPWNAQWVWVEPKLGHVIVNVADSLQALSGGRLHSCLHRVSQITEGFDERWMVSYFLRPEHGASLAVL